MMNDLQDQATADRFSAVEVDAMLHDAAYAEAEPDLERLLALARAATGDAPLPALRARVLLEHADDSTTTALLADLLAAALTAVHSQHSEADAALLLRVQVHRAVERAEIRVAIGSRPEHRCSSFHGCTEPAWWLIEGYAAEDDGRRLVKTFACCRQHADEVRVQVARHPGLSTTVRSLLPGHPDFTRDRASRS